MSAPRRWKIWRVVRDGGEPWMGVRGPATDPPRDSDLSGSDWARAAEVDVVEVVTDYDRIAAISDVLQKTLALEDEDGKPAGPDHYTECARQITALDQSATQPTKETYTREQLEAAAEVVAKARFARVSRFYGEGDWEALSEQAREQWIALDRRYITEALDAIDEGKGGDDA